MSYHPASRSHMEYEYIPTYQIEDGSATRVNENEMFPGLRHAKHQQKVNSRPWQSNSLISWFLRLIPSQSFTRRPTIWPNNSASVNINTDHSSWMVHWYTPVSIVVLIIVGSMSALSHHIYYSKLHEQQVGTIAHQQWVVRVGTGLAFLTKAALACAIGVSRQQRVWVSLRKRFISINGIDALFGVAHDLIYFLNGEMMAQAKLATVMAVFKWIIPIIAIFTPGTISIISRTQLNHIPCTVPSIRFPYENFANSTLINDVSAPDLSDKWRVVYRAPSALATKIFTLSAYSGDIAAGALATDEQNPQQGCGLNCTYHLSFDGPAVHCIEEVPWNSSTTPWSRETFFTPSTPGPQRNNLVYLGAEFVAEMRDAKKLWIGHRVRTSQDPSLNIPEEIFDVHVYRCQAFVGQYNVSAQVLNRRITSKIDAVMLLYPVEEVPDANNSETYEANWAVLDTLAQILGGDATVQATGSAASYNQVMTNLTKVGSTPLIKTVTSDELRTVPQLGSAVEDMGHRMVTSLLAERHLIYAANTSTTCHSTQVHNIYVYRHPTLLAIYTSAIGIAVLMAVVGGVALAQNRIAYDDNFSTFVATTRDSTLDDLFQGAAASLGGSPLNKVLGQTRLMFGEVNNPDRTIIEGGETVSHAAFGPVRRVRRLRKGRPYF